MTSAPTREDLAEYKKIRAANIAKREARLVRVMGPEAAKALFGIETPKHIKAPLPSATMQQNPAQIQTLSNTVL